MKKVKLLTKIFLLGALSISTNLNAQHLRVKQPIPSHVAMDIAQQDLPNLLAMIEPEDMKDYGFSLSDNFNGIQLGQPFYLVTLPLNVQASINETIELSPYTIMVPVVMNGVTRCVVFVSPEEGQWKAIGIGEANFVKNNPTIFNKINESHVIVSVPQQSQQFYMYNERFQPMIAFEGMSMESISLSELITLNNEKVPEAKMGQVEDTKENTPEDIK